MARLCEGLTVLDLTQGMAGGLATMVLTDAGAEVIKVEPPAGDWSRSQPAFIMWNRGKKGIVLDLKTPAGQRDLKALAATADVLVTSGRPGAAQRLGLDYAELRAANRGLVYCSITGFGPLKKFAHLKAYDAIVNAKTGRTGAFAQQIKKDGPTYAALMCSTYGAAMYSLQAIMAALFIRERTGKGQKVETSMAQALIAYDWGWLAWQLARRPEPPPQPMRGSPTPQYFVGRTKDGRWLQMANAMSHLMVNYMMAAGAGDLYEQPRYQGLPNIPPGPDMEELFRLLHARMQEKTLDEWMHLFTKEFDVAAEPFLHTQQAIGHPQVIHNGNFVKIHDPAAGKTKQLGPLVKFSETPLEPHGPAPRLGQHTAEVLASVPSRERKTLLGRLPMPRLPLEGVTIVEFATWFAGPFGTAILADMGARVIKVESLEGDPFRRSQAVAIKPQQGKESFAVDMKKPEGQRLAYELIKKADVLMHNFRPGVPERLGIAYETVKEINPKIVYLYAGSYGSSGPYAHRAAMHPIPGAICGGAMYQAGRAMPPPPGQPMTYDELRAASSSLFQANEGNPDSSSSIAVAAAILMGLYGRERHGIGQYMETTMVGSCLYANGDDAIQYEGKPPRLLPDGDLNGLHALYRFYRAREGWVFLACATDREWRDFCAATRREDLQKDPRFATHDLRLEHDRELIAELEKVFPEKPASEWEMFLARHNVACAEARGADYAEFANTEPAMKEAGLLVTVNHPSLGDYQRLGPGIQFSEGGSRLGPTTYVGEHTQQILQELGYAQQQIEVLKSARVVTWSTRTMDSGD